MSARLFSLFLLLVVESTTQSGCTRLLPAGSRDAEVHDSGALDAAAHDAGGEGAFDLGDGASDQNTATLKLGPIADQRGVYEGTSISIVDANNQLTGDDTTTKGAAIGYSCRFDRTVDGTVPIAAELCGTIIGLTFDAQSGRLSWDTRLGQVGAVELAITGKAAGEEDRVVFVVEVVGDSRPTGLAVGETKRVSVGPGGVQANGASNGHTVGLSANGRHVVYTSVASNLVSGDTNGVADTFVTDVRTGRTTRVSVSSGGVQGDGPSDGSTLGAAVSGIGISDDGYTVVFISAATNLVPNDTNGAVDVFAHDRRTGQTRRVSLSSSGAQADGDSQRALVSGAGRYVVFQSAATNLVAGDTNGLDDCFVHDVQLRTTVVVSRGVGGVWANADCNHPRISADGKLVGFFSRASNLVAGDSNGRNDAFVNNLVSKDLIVVSKHPIGAFGDDHSYTPTFSGDGRFVTFHGSATNLVTGDTNGAEDVFRYRLSDGQILRVSTSGHASAQQSDGRSYVSRSSHDGRFISFNSVATNLMPGSTVSNGVMDVFVKDMQSGAVVWASQGVGGAPGDGASDRAYVSADGTHVAFESAATNLVAGDTNGVKDIFVHRFR